jgi:hypothetical protein
MRARFALLVPLLVLSGCGPAVGDVRIKVRPARPADCPLEIVDVRNEDRMPGAKFGGGEYEMIGSVLVGAEKGADAMSEEIRALVRPRACAMGGEVLSLLVTGEGSNRRGHAQQNIAFQVWAKVTAGSAGPKPF